MDFMRNTLKVRGLKFKVVGARSLGAEDMARCFDSTWKWERIMRRDICVCVLCVYIYAVFGSCVVHTYISLREIKTQSSVRGHSTLLHRR